MTFCWIWIPSTKRNNGSTFWHHYKKLIYCWVFWSVTPCLLEAGTWEKLLLLCNMKSSNCSWQMHFKIPIPSLYSSLFAFKDTDTSGAVVATLLALTLVSGGSRCFVDYNSTSVGGGLVAATQRRRRGGGGSTGYSHTNSIWNINEAPQMEMSSVYWPAFPNNRLHI